MNEKSKRVKEYNGLSYSKLSKLATHPRNLIATEKEESSSLDHGSLVDCLMFTPEDFNDQFYQTSLKKPGGEMMKWLDAYLNYELPADYTLQDTDSIILEARKISGYNASLTEATALKKFHEACDNFLTEMSLAGDRIIVTDDDMIRAISKQSRLLSNEFTAPYFNNSEFQYELYFDLDDTPMKGLLDGVIFDHEAKTIRPWDLKTTSESTLAFENEFIKWKYYLQASLYRAGLSILFKDYKVLPFQFIIVNDWEEPLIWEVDDAMHSVGMLGGITRSGRKIKGIYQLIEEYKWHEQHKQYDYQPSVYTNNGVKLIDII